MLTISAPKIITDTWILASWDEFISTIELPEYQQAKNYYYDSLMRLEMSPVGNDHAKDHAIIIFMINLWATIKGIPLNAHDNCSYRKTGEIEAQPDISYYIAEKAQIIPWGTSIINLQEYPAPNLIIEIAHSTLADDQGQKRLLYEDLGVDEYWIVDVKNVKIIAFTIADNGSKRIKESLVLPGLKISLLETALKQSRKVTQTEVGTWFLSQIQ